MFSRRTLAAFVLLVACGASSSSAEDSVAERVAAAIRAAEESCFLRGDTEAVDARIATLATKHRDLAVAASGARLRVARTYAATGRFRIAADLMRDLVRSEARPERARSHAHNWAYFAALAGDKQEALEALRMAVESDRADLEWMAKDLDLALLQGEEELARLLAILWPQVCDLGGFDAALATLYHVRGIPRAVLLDRQGRIVGKDLRGEYLSEAVRHALVPPR